jgi:hypothetical protein
MLLVARLVGCSCLALRLALGIATRLLASGPWGRLAASCNSCCVLGSVALKDVSAKESKEEGSEALTERTAAPAR